MTAVVAMLSLIGTAAADDHFDRAFRPNCERQEPAPTTPQPRETQLLKLENVGPCQSHAQRTPPPWQHCGDCGMMRRWDRKLQIWRQPGR
jgi:hypothetical protein